MTPSTRAARRGFTLIELLAVIAIVGVLAAIIIAMTRSARESANASRCVSNLRTLLNAHALYRQDFKGRSPPVAVGPSDPLAEGHNVNGFSLLRRYYRSGPRYIWTFDHQYILEPVEQCPSAMAFDPLNDGKGIDYNYAVKDVNYDLFFTEPAKTPLIWDGWWPKGNATHKIPLRHSGKANIGYMDGHVERLGGSDGRLYENYMWGLYNSGTPSPGGLGGGSALGTTVRPSS